MPYTTADLISGIKRRGAVPTSQSTFQATDFLAMADAEVRTELLPMILKARESYYSFDVTYTITPSNAVYAIPTRAVGAKLQNVFLVDSNSVRCEMNLIEETDVINPNVPLSCQPSFYFKGNNIVIVPPNPSNFVSLVMTIFVRPNQLVATTSCAQVTAVNSNVLTVNAVPSTFSTSTLVDLLKGVPHYDFWAIDQTPTVVNSGASTITFSSLPSGIAVGDWVALAQQSPVVQIPVEFQGILEQRVANAFLQSQGFLQALEKGKETLKGMEGSFLLINPRSERNAKKIVSRSGLLRRSNSWP